MNQMDIGPAGSGSGDALPHETLVNGQTYEPETAVEAAAQGKSEQWKFWEGQIIAGLRYERRWRKEAQICEDLYFGPENANNDMGNSTKSAAVDDKTALIHANINVLKPMLYSETPQPIVRRRFKGDGKMDPTDLMAAECAQRLASFMLDTEDFDGVMENARDDWLVAGRGAARVYYEAQTAEMQILDPATQQPVTLTKKVSERVKPGYVEWRRMLLAPAASWENTPWVAFEIPMTRKKVMTRFAKEIAARISFNDKGMADSARVVSDDNDTDNVDREGGSETGKKAESPFDTAMVWEIWNREEGSVVWWTSSYTEGVLDQQDDVLGLEKFFPMPKPLLFTTRGETMVPRPPIAYYENRAREINKASDKLKQILNVISISGLFPGDMDSEVKQLLDGTSSMIPVSSWLKLMEKGGASGVIEWLPLNHMIAAIQSLITLREQAKQAMFEASGVSDIMRSQGDPTETATAQNLKGRYSSLRLSDSQRKIANYALELLRLMVEMALEHYDLEHIAEIVGLDLPMTEADRAQIIEEYEKAVAAYQQQMQLYPMIVQAIEAGQLQGPVPPEPQEPEKIQLPQTSFEAVHARLKTDYGRKLSVTIETASTILADEESDKSARIEFMTAFTGFVQQMMPLAGTGVFDGKMIKELLLFGVRGFPKSRTLETMIASLPDEPDQEPPEDTQITIAKIRAEVDMQKAKLDAETDLQVAQIRESGEHAKLNHEKQMKGADLLMKATEERAPVSPIAALMQ